MKRLAHTTTAALAGLGLMATVGWQAQEADAADHAEAPTAAADAAADLADIYAWHTDDRTLVVGITFAGLGLAGDPAMYDEDVLYGVHIDNDGDNLPDYDVWARFGQDELGEWGLQVENLRADGRSAQLVADGVTSVVPMVRLLLERKVSTTAC